MSRRKVVYDTNTKLELRRCRFGCGGQQTSGAVKKPVTKFDSNIMDNKESNVPSSTSSDATASPTPNVSVTSPLDVSNNGLIPVVDPTGTLFGIPNGVGAFNSGNNGNSGNNNSKNNSNGQTGSSDDSSRTDSDDSTSADDDDNGKNSSGSKNGNNSNNNASKGSFDNSAFEPSDPSCQTINENDGRLQYTGAWTLESKDPNGIYFTSHTTRTANSQVSITFNGTSVTVIGVVHDSNSTNPPAAASYTIDDYPPISLPLPFTSRDIPNQAFFESEDLPLSAHKLVINVTTDGSPYTLNSLKICSRVTSPVAAALVPNTRTATRPNVPLIVGAVVGSAAFILLAVVGYFYFRRKKGTARPITRYPVLSWLRRGTATPTFTSTESIMRNNPTNPSSIEAFDKLSRIEKLSRVVSSFPLSELSVGTKTLSSTPIAVLQAMPDSPVLPAGLSASLALRSNVDRQSALSYVTVPERLPRSVNLERQGPVAPRPL